MIYNPAIGVEVASMQSFVPKDTTCFLQEARGSIGFGVRVPRSAIVKEGRPLQQRKMEKSWNNRSSAPIGPFDEYGWIWRAGALLMREPIRGVD